MSNNKIRDWTELDRLAGLDKLEELLLVGNPLYTDYRDSNAIPEYRVEVKSDLEAACLLLQNCWCKRLLHSMACLQDPGASAAALDNRDRLR